MADGVLGVLLGLAIQISLPDAARGVSFVFTTLAVTGQQAPGAPAGASFASLSNPSLNGLGEVAYRGSLEVGSGGVDSSNQRGVWGPDGSGGAAIQARQGDPAPGTSAGASFDSFSPPTLNDAGELAFQALLGLGTGGVTFSNNSGVWGPDASGDLDLLAREGEPAPGSPGLSYASLSSPLLNEAGQVAFETVLSGTPEAIIGPDGSGGLTTLAREDAVAPGVPNAFQFFNHLTLNDAGEVAFLGVIDPGGGVSGNNGIWGPDAAGALALRALDGQPAPGANPGESYVNFVSPPALNNAGELAFSGLLQLGTTGVSAPNGRGVFGPDASGDLTLRYRAGEVAPGAADGALFFSFEETLLNDARDLAFQGRLSSIVGDEAVFAPDGSGDVRLVARGGSQADDAAAGALYEAFDRLVMNEDGSIAFYAFLDTGTGGVTTSNDRALYYARAGGSPLLVIREGDSIELAPGDLRTVDFLLFETDTSSHRPNEADQMVFRARFTDGSQALLLAQVPEPSSLLLVFSGLIALSRRPLRQG